MDEDSNKKIKNISANTFNNLDVGQDESDTSNPNDMVVTEDSGPLQNTDESSHECDVAPPIEDDAYEENGRNEEGQELENNEVETNPNNQPRAILSSDGPENDSDDNLSLPPPRPSRLTSGSESNRSSGDDDTSSPESGDFDSDESIDNMISEVQSKQKAKYNWNLIYEVMYREHGLSTAGRFSSRKGNPVAFQSRFYGACHNVEKMKLLHCLNEHRGCVNSLNFNKAGNLLASGSDDLKIILWNWGANQVTHFLNSGHISNVFQTKFIETNNSITIVSSGHDGQVRYANISPSGSVQSKMLLNHNGPVRKIALAPNNRFEILTCGDDSKVFRCDLRDNCVERVITVKRDKHNVPLLSIAHHPLDAEFCVAGQDHYVRVYDKRYVQEPVYKMCPKHLEQRPLINHITCAVYNSTGSEIVASYRYENIYLFKNRTYIQGSYEHTYAGRSNNKTINDVNFFGINCEYVVSGSDCGNFFFWDKNSESIINWIKGDERGVVNCLEPHPNFPVLATSGLDHDIKIWMPSERDFPPAMEGLEKCLRRNFRRSLLCHCPNLRDIPSTSINNGIGFAFDIDD